MKLISSTAFLVLLAVGVAACHPAKRQVSANDLGETVGALRPLTSDERARDFDQYVSLFKSYYGPYQFKERVLGINFDNLAASLKAQAIAAKSDEEFVGFVMQLGATLKDGHVQIISGATSEGIASYSIPIVVTPLEQKAIVAEIKDDLKTAVGIELGDEVVSVDGKAPFDYLPLIMKYKSLAREESNQHLILHTLSRPSYMTDLVPKEQTVRLVIKKASGDSKTVDIPWVTKTYNQDRERVVPNPRGLSMYVSFADDLNSLSSHCKQMGQVDPIFVNDKTNATYGFVKVYPSDASRKKFGLADAEKPPIYAALYRYSGKTILLVRQATYHPEDYKSALYMKAYQALFSEYQPLADVLVLDQTHNPGGSYCAEFYNLFAKDGDIQSVQLLRADRKWINDLLVEWPHEDPKTIGSWDGKMLAAWGLITEQAYDAGRFMTDPIPLFTGSFFAEKKEAAWSKPMLVLIDELAGSCGDMFPMLVKANNRAKLFGQPTMGLGGNVEEVGVLSNSRVKVRMTRGLFYPYNPGRGPTDAEYIENNGVLPDVPYRHSVKDFRGSFVDYVKAFSDLAITQ